jgi:hypothetical protein
VLAGATDAVDRRRADQSVLDYLTIELRANLRPSFGPAVSAIDLGIDGGAHKDLSFEIWHTSTLLC